MTVGSSTDSVLSVEQMLSNAKKAAASKSVRAGASEVEKLLAGREENTDILDLTPVQRLLKQQEEEAARQDQTPYTEQDWFIRLKVSQLRAQLQTYTNIPGLDPSGAIMQSIEKEILDLANKQNAKFQEIAAKREEESKKLEEQKKAAADAPLSAEDMLSRSKTLASGGTLTTPISDEAQALLDKLGSNVDTTA